MDSAKYNRIKEVIAMAYLFHRPLGLHSQLEYLGRLYCHSPILMQRYYYYKNLVAIYYHHPVYELQQLGYARLYKQMNREIDSYTALTSEVPLIVRLLDTITGYHQTVKNS